MADLASSERTFRERQSGVYTATLLDPSGTAIPLSKVTSLEMTLTNVETGAAINSRDAQDILNVNGVSFDEDGLLTWTISPADNQILSSAKKHGEVEKHRATFWLKWSDGGVDFEHNWEITLNITAADWITT